MKAPRSFFSYTFLCHLTLAALASSVTNASEVFEMPAARNSTEANANTVGVVFTHEELFHQAVHNMEDELEPNGGLRIVPIMGKNHVQSIYDLLYLKGVDLALVRADAIEYVKRNGDKPSIQNVVQNITRISEEKIVILAREAVKSIDDLQGKSIGLGLPGSGEYVTGTLLLESLGIEASPVAIDNVTAAQRIRGGEIDAMVYLLRESDAILGNADAEALKYVRNLKSIDKIHVLPLPENDDLKTIYSASSLTHDDLPGVIVEGNSVDTYSVDAILAAYNWRSDVPRYNRVKRFIQSFVASLDGLKAGPYQPLWDRVSMDVQTPNVTRLELVDTVLAERQAQVEQARLEAIARREARAEARKADQIAELTRQQNVIADRLDEKMNAADVDELEKLLEKLNSFMEQLEGETSTAVTE